MRFKLIDPKNDADVLGGPVTEDNVYLRAYGHPIEGERAVRELAVGESTLLKFNLSGTQGVYRCVRLE